MVIRLFISITVTNKRVNQNWSLFLKDTVFKRRYLPKTCNFLCEQMAQQTRYLLLYRSWWLPVPADIILPASRLCLLDESHWRSTSSLAKWAVIKDSVIKRNIRCSGEFDMLCCYRVIGRSYISLYKKVHLSGSMMFMLRRKCSNSLLFTKVLFFCVIHKNNSLVHMNCNLLHLHRHSMVRVYTIEDRDHNGCSCCSFLCAFF